MSAKFVMFSDPHADRPVLVNPAHVRTAYQRRAARAARTVHR
jgi:hypothetical protein